MNNAEEFSTHPTFTVLCYNLVLHEAEISLHPSSSKCNHRNPLSGEQMVGIIWFKQYIMECYQNT